MRATAAAPWSPGTRHRLRDLGSARRRRSTSSGGSQEPGNNRKKADGAALRKASTMSRRSPPWPSRHSRTKGPLSDTNQVAHQRRAGAAPLTNSSGRRRAACAQRACWPAPCKACAAPRSSNTEPRAWPQVLARACRSRVARGGQSWARRRSSTTNGGSCLSAAGPARRPSLCSQPRPNLSAAYMTLNMSSTVAGPSTNSDRRCAATAQGLPPNSSTGAPGRPSGAHSAHSTTQSALTHSTHIRSCAALTATRASSTAWASSRHSSRQATPSSGTAQASTAQLNALAMPSQGVPRDSVSAACSVWRCSGSRTSSSQMPSAKPAIKVNRRTPRTNTAPPMNVCHSAAAWPSSSGSTSSVSPPRPHCSGQSTRRSTAQLRPRASSGSNRLPSTRAPRPG